MELENGENNIKEGEGKTGLEEQEVRKMEGNQPKKEEAKREDWKYSDNLLLIAEEFTQRYKFRSNQFKHGRFSSKFIRGFDQKWKKAIVCKKIPMVSCNNLKYSSQVSSHSLEGFEILRELLMLKLVSAHPNINRLYGFLYHPSHNSLYFILESLDANLSAIFQSRQLLSISHVKCLTKQLLEGVRFLHEDMKIIHSNLISSNILLSSDCHLKIIGFEKATFQHESPFTVQEFDERLSGEPFMIRSPEVIFSVGNAHRSFSSDLWAIGLLFARMILTEPLLDYANSVIRLIKNIVEFVPIPIPIEDEQEKEQEQGQGQGQEESSSSDGKAERFMRAVGFRMNSAARDFLLVKCRDAWKSKFTFQERFRSKLLKCRPNITIDLTLLQAIDLAERFFVFNPLRRITAVDALAHPFLDRLDSNELIFHYSAPPYSSLWEDEENFSWERYRREISEKLSSLYPSSLSRPDQDRLTLLDRLDWDLTLGEFLRRVDEETFLS